MTDLRKCNQCGEWFMSTPEVMDRHRKRACQKPPLENLIVWPHLYNRDIQTTAPRWDDHNDQCD